MKRGKMLGDRGFEVQNKATGRNAKTFFTITGFYAIMEYIKQFRRIQDGA